MVFVIYYLEDVEVKEPLVNYTRNSLIDNVLDWLLIINQALIAVSHWLFAVEYLKLALKLPLMLCQLAEEEI